MMVTQPFPSSVGCPGSEPMMFSFLEGVELWEQRRPARNCQIPSQILTIFPINQPKIVKGFP